MDCCMSGEELTLVASVISIAFAEKLNVDEINLLGALLQTVGQNLTLIAAQRDACEDKPNEISD